MSSSDPTHKPSFFKIGAFQVWLFFFFGKTHGHIGQKPNIAAERCGRACATTTHATAQERDRVPPHQRPIFLVGENGTDAKDCAAWVSK